MTESMRWWEWLWLGFLGLIALVAAALVLAFAGALLLSLLYVIKTVGGAL